MGTLDKFEEKLSDKTGPLPNWGWAVLAAVALILFMRRRGGTADAQNAAAVAQGDVNDPAFDPNGVASGDPTQLPFPTGPLDQFLANDPTYAAYPTGLTPQGVPSPVTNVQWSRLAGDYLMALGDVPSLVQTALTKYLNGQPLGQSEQAVINGALTHFGSPPEGTLSVIPVATPTPTPTTTPPVTTPPTATSTLLKNQFHRVGVVGRTFSLTDYIKGIYPGASQIQLNALRWWTTNDPKNIRFRQNLLRNQIPGGAPIEFSAGPQYGTP